MNTISDAAGSALLTVLAASVFAAGSAIAQSTPSIPPQLVTPDRLESSLGTLEFKDGAPSKGTVEKIL